MPAKSCRPWQRISPVLLAMLTCLPACSQSPQDQANGEAATTARGASTERVSKKRAAPPKLLPLEHQGVRYSELRAGRAQGLPQNGGYIVAREIAGNKELWRTRIYEIAGNADMESDKLDVYIVSLQLADNGRQLLITNERGDRYALHLSEQRVERLTR